MVALGGLVAGVAVAGGACDGGMAGGAALRKAIYESKSRVEILTSVEAFFENRLELCGQGTLVDEGVASIP